MLHANHATADITVPSWEQAARTLTLQQLPTSVTKDIFAFLEPQFLGRWTIAIRDVAVLKENTVQREQPWRRIAKKAHTTQMKVRERVSLARQENYATQMAWRHLWTALLDLTALRETLTAIQTNPLAQQEPSLLVPICEALTNAYPAHLASTAQKVPLPLLATVRPRSIVEEREQFSSQATRST